MGKEFSYSRFRIFEFLPRMMSFFGFVGLICLVKHTKPNREPILMGIFLLVFFVICLVLEFFRIRTNRREPQAFFVDEEELEVIWSDRKCRCPINLVHVRDEEVGWWEAPGTLYRCKRIEAGEDSFLVFSSLVGYEEFLSILS